MYSFDFCLFSSLDMSCQLFLFLTANFWGASSVFSVKCDETHNSSTVLEHFEIQCLVEFWILNYFYHSGLSSEIFMHFSLFLVIFFSLL